MRSGRHGRSKPTEPANAAFNPWAPRTPGAPGPARPPTAGSPPAAGGRATLAAPPTSTTHFQGDSGPIVPPLTAELGGRAPVADDARPSGAGPTPPVTWPAPRLLSGGGDGGGRRRGALVAFTAFLLGAILVGVVLAAYAAGDRRNDAAAPVDSTTTLPLRATGDLDIQKILDIARPSVVTIQTGGPDSMFGGAGTGVVISEDGLILTNAHVLEGAGNNITVRFSDSTVANASLVGASTKDDIALIQADKVGLTAATLGSSANLLVGDPVVAIGNALNLGGDPSVTSGIVSAKDREISDGDIQLDDLIQTDAAINPGNSGGPLVNANGEVVGINTAIIQGAQSVGFSIAIDSVIDLIETLKAGGGDVTGTTADLGATTVDVDSPSFDQQTRDQFGITADAGAVIVSLDPDGGAAIAGLVEGDVVIEFDGDVVTSTSDLSRLVGAREPGDQATVTVERFGERQSYVVTLGE